MFEALPISYRGELIEHEGVHLAQYQGYFGELHEQGIVAFDPSIGYIDINQLTTTPIAELMAQTVGADGVLAEDYKFVLVDYSSNGQPFIVNAAADTNQAWRHLESHCGNANGTHPEVRDLLVRALWGDEQAYLEATQRCGRPLHEWIRDRVRPAR